MIRGCGVVVGTFFPKIIQYRDGGVCGKGYSSTGSEGTSEKAENFFRFFRQPRNEWWNCFLDSSAALLAALHIVQDLDEQ